MKWRSKSNHKPLPLKQRTSSVDARRDYNSETWYSVLGLLKLREYVISVDHFSIWRRHLAWAQDDGKILRDHMTQRFSSSMVFMSLLLSTELGTLFNSSMITTKMRHCLQNEEYWEIEFWIGICIIASAVLTLLGLISTYTAWSMVSTIDPTNAHCVFRSSIGQYVAELPGRFVVGSIYSFLVWVMMFFFVLLPVGYWSISLLVVSLLLFVHTICVLSAFGRIIMHSGAMGHERVFEQSYERNLLPHSLHAHLLAKARANLSKNTSIMRQYRSNSRPINGFYTEDELSEYLAQEPYNVDTSMPDNANHTRPSASSQNGYDNIHGGEFSDSYHYRDSSRSQEVYHKHQQQQEYDFSTEEPRRRADSTVRFADEVDVVTSSPPSRNGGEPMISVAEADTPVSHLSTPVSSGDTAESATETSRTDESNKSDTDIIAEEQETIGGSGSSIREPNTMTPQRPGIARRNRSNTTADNDLDALFRKTNNQRRSPDTVPLPPSNHFPRPQPHFPARVGSESNLNAPKQHDWLRTRPPVDARSYNTNSINNTTFDKRHSTGNLPPNKPNSTGSLSVVPANAPGLSVLENAAKLQRQWRNSYTERSNSEQNLGGSSHQFQSSPSSNRHHRPASSLESQASIQELWVNSSPAITNNHKMSLPEAQPPKRAFSAPQVVSTTATGSKEPPLTSIPPPTTSSSMMPHVASSDALSSKGGSIGDNTNALSEAEEEAFMRDYGGSDDDGEPWGSGYEATEAASLLDHDRLERGGAPSYMSVDNDATPRKKNSRN